MSKNECIDLINFYDNIDKLFGFSVFNNGVIRFRIYAYHKTNNLIENHIDHEIELIEHDNKTYVKASRVERGDVTNKRKYPDTNELIISMTKIVGNNIDINILEQYMRLLIVCLKPELDKHIF